MAKLAVERERKTQEAVPEKRSIVTQVNWVTTFHFSDWSCSCKACAFNDKYIQYE